MQNAAVATFVLDREALVERFDRARTRSNLLFDLIGERVVEPSRARYRLGYPAQNIENNIVSSHLTTL